MATTTTENAYFDEVLTTEETARLFRKSGEHVRNLSERKWHPCQVSTRG